MASEGVDALPRRDEVPVGMRHAQPHELVVACDEMMMRQTDCEPELQAEEASNRGDSLVWDGWSRVADRSIMAIGGR